MPARTVWRSIITLSRFALAIVILWALIRFKIIDIGAVAHLWMKPAELSIAILCLLAGIFVAAQRWRLLLRVQGVDVRYGPICRLVGFSTLAGMILPGATSGEALKMLWMMRSVPGARVPAALSIVMDKIIALLAVIVTGAVAALLDLGALTGNPALRLFVLSLWLVVAGVALGVLVLVLSRRWRIGTRFLGEGRGRLYRFMRQVVDVIRAYLDVPGTLVQAFGLALVCCLLMVVGVTLLADTVDAAALTPPQYAMGLVAGMLANLLPLTPGGIGVGESGFGYICTLLDTGSGAAYGSVFLAFRLASILALLPFLLVMPQKELIKEEGMKTSVGARPLSRPDTGAPMC